MSPFLVRMPDGLKTAIQEDAQLHNRSINGAIVARLEESLRQDDGLERLLADPSLRSMALLMITAWKRGARTGAITTQRPRMSMAECVEDPRCYRYAAWAVAGALGLPLPTEGPQGIEAGTAIGSLGTNAEQAA